VGKNGSPRALKREGRAEQKRSSPRGKNLKEDEREVLGDEKSSTSQKEVEPKNEKCTVGHGEQRGRGKKKWPQNQWCEAWEKERSKLGDQGLGKEKQNHRREH